MDLPDIWSRIVEGLLESRYGPGFWRPIWIYRISGLKVLEDIYAL
jgi:hypothetical protein